MTPIAKCLAFGVTLIVLCQGSVLPDQKSQRVFGQFNKYYLYTRDNFREPQTLEATADSVAASYLSAEKETLIIVHGQGDSAFTEYSLILRETILRNHDFNVIIVDWSIIAGTVNNPQTLAGYVGTALGEFIQFLTQPVVEDDNNDDDNTDDDNDVNDEADPYINVRTIHLVGFGAGAHVAGVAGRYVRDAVGPVGRLTGLDPVIIVAPADSMSKEDASYVEVIHTDGFGTGAHAIGDPIGHVDFYPNRGTNRQLGCTTNVCSHQRAWELFEASIEHRNSFFGSFCSTLAEMTANRCTASNRRLEMGGTALNKYMDGIFSLTTTRAYPFF